MTGLRSFQTAIRKAELFQECDGQLVILFLGLSHPPYISQEQNKNKERKFSRESVTLVLHPVTLVLHPVTLVLRCLAKA
jgi:hypothetical protein